MGNKEQFKITLKRELKVTREQTYITGNLESLI